MAIWIAEADLLDTIGKEAAVLLLQARGGQQVYFPKKPRPEHPLAHLLGMEVFTLLCREWGGNIGLLPVPYDRITVRKAVLEMLKKGDQSYSNIAMKMRTSVRYVEKIASEYRKRQIRPQQARLL